MILGIVRGNVVSTRKLDNLVGYKFLIVEPVYRKHTDYLIAADTLGAGVGEYVLITKNEPTQYALEHNAPVDAFIVGIVDEPPKVTD